MVPLLLVASAALVVYASLYPFSGWRWPPGQRVDAAAPALAAWPERFDIVSNLLGYVPLGAAGACAGAPARSGRRRCATPPRWPPCCPTRSRSRRTSCRCGCRRCWTGCSTPSGRRSARCSACGWLAPMRSMAAPHRRALVRSPQPQRPHAAGAVAGRPAVSDAGPARPGPVWERLREPGRRVQWRRRGPASGALAGGRPARQRPLSPAAELLAVALGLLAPCLLASAWRGRAGAAPGWRRGHRARVRGHHAVDGAELRPAARVGLVHGQQPGWARARLRAGAAAARQRPAHRGGLALVVLTAGVGLVAQAPADPYFAASLQGWEQGRFIRFHGLAQWIGWLWPYAATLWLLRQSAGRD